MADVYLIVFINFSLLAGRAQLVKIHIGMEQNIYLFIYLFTVIYIAHFP